MQPASGESPTPNMNHYRYRVYYEWQGRSPSDPFAREKSPDEIEDARREFPAELRHRLLDPDADVKTSNPQASSVELSVRTTASCEELDAALAQTLGSWRLFCDRLA